MFSMHLFKIRPFAAGNLASLLAADLPGRHAVHADHLVAGDLAPAARLRLRVDAAVGRHLPVAAHRRLPRGRTDRRTGSPTGTAPGCSPPGDWSWSRRRFIGFLLIPVDFAYWQFALLLLINGVGVRAVRGAERHLDHEQRAGQPARRGVRDARHVHELRQCAVDRHLLLTDGGRTGQQPSGLAPVRTDPAGRVGGRGRPGRRAAAGRLASSRRSSATTRSRPCSSPRAPWTGCRRTTRRPSPASSSSRT